MRNLVSLGLFALTLSMFSSQVLASNVDACDEVKKAKKGLYGLCVAWHNADEEGKNEIADRYRDRSGGDEVPGSTTAFSCPCWSGVELGSIGNVTPPMGCFLETVLGDMALFGPSPTQQQNFLTDGIGCGYIANYLDTDETRIQMGVTNPDVGDAGQQCADEMEKILERYFTEGLDCS